MLKSLRSLSAMLAICLATTTLGGAANATQNSDERLKSAATFAGAYLAGTAAMSNFDYDAASFYYNEALIFDPGNTDLQRELMIALLNNGEFDRAVPLAEQLANMPSIERVSRLILATEAIKENDQELISEFLDFTRKNDLERLLTGVMDAWASYGEGDVDLALSMVDNLSGPDWYNLFQAYHGALIAHAAGRADDARERYEDAMNDATGGSASPLTYLRLSEAFAGFLVERGEIGAARDAVDRGLGISPNNPNLLSLSENLAGDAEAQPLSIETAQQGAAEILLNIGSAINREGAETFATIYLQLALALRPGGPQALYELGSIADRLNLTEDAVSYYQQVPEDSPLNRTAALQQGLALAALDRADEAIETLGEMVKQNPTDYQGYMALGGVLASERRFEEAAELYTTALENLDPEDSRFWPIHYRLGIAYERTDQWPLAEEKFKYALTLSPDQPDILNYLGYSWIDMNINLDEGLEMIEKAVDQRPRDGFIVDSLGWAHYRLGNFDEAVEALERATDLRPRDPTINDHLGDAYWRVGRKLEAAFQWSQVLDMEDSTETDKDEVRAKLDAANSGELPLIAESVVDNDQGNVQATGESAEEDTSSDDG